MANLCPTVSRSFLFFFRSLLANVHFSYNYTPGHQKKVLNQHHSFVYFDLQPPSPFSTENRFTAIYDFGYVAMNFGWVYPEDSGEYVCRATNLYGSDETRAILKTTGKPGIIYESQLPKGMKSIEKIREMEASWQQ